MSSSKKALQIILYWMLISLISGRPFYPPKTLPRPGNRLQGVKIPLFMMNLYQTLIGNKKDNHRPENQILDGSDTVQSLAAKKFTVENNRLSLTFDLSSISKNDELRMVELQVHLPPFTKSSNVTADIYHANRGENKLFLGSVMKNITNEQNSSWTKFNVTKMIEQSLWVQKLTNHEEGDMQSVDMSELEHSRKINKRDVSLHEVDKDLALIVFYTKHKPSSESETPSLIHKLAVNTMKLVAFRRNKRTRSETQQSTPSNSYPNAAEEHRPSHKTMDREEDYKEVFPKYKRHSSLRGPVLLY
ncbi:nodal homolog 2-A-like [Bufo bufo]|uniref:nodal homolog 2-A-like n=1 Tax=Bufo bufo TaxID=8384 RepID=UPI001ABE3DE5|nr:nodal homolog 2-A-like [Bufo bufo]